jgi:HEAT repeat protein
MSNGDDADEEPPEEEPPEAETPDEETPEAEEADAPATTVTVEDLDERLDDAEAALEEAETEADLDEVEATVDEVEADIEAADLPEPDEDEEEEEEPPSERLRGRVEDLRDDIKEQRGPYAEDVATDVDDAAARVRETRWTDDGIGEVRETVASFLDDDAEHVEVRGDVGDDAAADALADLLDDAASAVEDAGLDPDGDAETVAALVEAADALADGLDDAEEWDDLSVREKLDVQGFYDRLTPENRKDFPPELTAIRVAEAENDPEPILMGLDYFESDFMEENCIDALRRLGPEEAFEEMHARAQKRDRPAIEVLGKIGDDRAVETLVEFIQDEGNPPLQKTTLRALGEIGSEEATQDVANRLVAEDPEVRGHAARALGRIGDARGVEPLADALDEDDADEVRGAAAWALVQIGTETALETAAEYTDDRAYLVQHEAEKAADALGDEAETTPV